MTAAGGVVGVCWCGCSVARVVLCWCVLVCCLYWLQCCSGWSGWCVLVCCGVVAGGGLVGVVGVLRYITPPPRYCWSCWLTHYFYLVVLLFNCYCWCCGVFLFIIYIVVGVFWLVLLVLELLKIK